MTRADYQNIHYAVCVWESVHGLKAEATHEREGVPVVITLRDGYGNEAVLTCETTDPVWIRRGLTYWERRLVRAVRPVGREIPVLGTVKS